MPEATAGLRDLAGAHDVALCDVFGVLHDGNGVFPAAVEALSVFRARGGTVVLVSNSAEPGPRLAEALAARGASAAYDAVVTSADVARALLREREPKAILHVGPIRDRVLFEGLTVTLTGSEAAELVVCTGFPDDDLDATLSGALRGGCVMLCTNPDTSLMVGTTLLRFAGLVAERYREIGGVVVETGKPGALIYAHALSLAEGLRGGLTAAERTLGIGDTVALDVAGALARGFSALHIGQPHPAQPYPPVVADRLRRMPALIW